MKDCQCILDLNNQVFNRWNMMKTACLFNDNDQIILIPGNYNKSLNVYDIN